MEVLYPRCCGLDVHKSSITARVLIAQSGKPLKNIRRFGCTTRELGSGDYFMPVIVVVLWAPLPQLSGAPRQSRHSFRCRYASRSSSRATRIRER